MLNFLLAVYVFGLSNTIDTIESLYKRQCPIGMIGEGCGPIAIRFGFYQVNTDIPI